MKRLLILLALTTSVLAGCTWVSTTESGDDVRLMVAPTEGCRRVGAVSASTRATLAGMPRSEDKIASELEALARNEAAGLGANAIVAASEIISGRREYTAYVCPAPGA